jgi:tetratricopeptide (TPR) repeat protein
MTRFSVMFSPFRKWFAASTLAALTAWSAPVSAQSMDAAQREAFARATDGDIAIAEAEAAENAGKIEDARKLYKYALQVNAIDSETWYQAARFELRQGKKEAALRYLDEAKKRDAENLPAMFDRIVLLDELGRKADAESAAVEYAKAAPNDVRAQYFLGSAALAKGDKQAASVAFAEGSKGDDRYAALSDCQRAIIANEADESGAGELAKGALARAPNEECKARLTVYAEKASSRETGPWLNGRGVLGFEFDSNASLVSASVANSLSVPRQSKPIAGFRVIADLKLTFRPIARELFTLELDAGFINATHLNDRRRLVLVDPANPASGTTDRGLAQFDYGGPSGTIRLVSRFGGDIKFEVGVDLGARNMWLNAFQKNFVLSLGAYPSAGVIFSPGHVLYALGMIEYRDFHDRLTSTDPFNRDSLSIFAGLFYQIPVWIFDGIVTGGFDQDNTKGREFFLRGGHGQVGLRAHVLTNLSLFAFVSGNFRVYERATPKRFEKRWEYGGNVRYDVIKHLALTLSYSFMTNDSTDVTSNPNQVIEGFTYRRHLVSLGVEGYF